MHGNELNVVELEDDTFAVRKELLSPWYYRNVPQVKDKDSQIELDGMPFVVMPAESIINDLDALIAPHAMDDYGYPYDGGEHNNYPAKRPYPHQKHTSRWLFSTSQISRGLHVHSSMGCVDAETEYLTPKGWKRIADYVEGDLVMEVNPENLEGNFILPTVYVKKPEIHMNHLKTAYGLDQVLSNEHRNILFNYENGKLCHKVFSTTELTLKYSQEIHPNKYRFAKGVFYTKEDGVKLTASELRLMVAIMADGHFYARQNNDQPNNTSHPLWCKFKLAKQRKIERLKTLLEECGIPYTFNVCARDKSMEKHHQEQVYFCFYAPRNDKNFEEYYYDCSSEQLKIILDEIPHWDGHFQKATNNTVYYSNSKADMDFISYAVTVTGGNCSIRKRDRLSPAAGHKPVTGYELVWGGSRGILEYFNYKPHHIQKVASSDGFKYCFSVPRTFWLARRNGKTFVTGNTGKSLSCLWTVDYLFKIGAIKKVLIVAPKIVMRSAWLKEINSEMMWLTTCIKQGVARDRKSNAQIDIINHDGVSARVSKFKKLVGKRTYYNFEQLDENYDLIIYDECTAIKTVTTQRWKATNRWFNYLNERYGTRLWLLTGTPLAQSPMDAYGLAKIVNPESVPSSLDKWRGMTMYCVSEAAHKYEVRDEAAEMCAAALQPSIRFELSDCTDLPEHQFYYIPVEKTEKQKRLFIQISRDFIAEMDSATTIMINNGAAKQIKLLQLLAGCIYDEEHNTHETDATNKFNALVEIIDQLPDDQPIVVFTDFTHVQTWLKNKLEHHYSDKLIELINGSTSPQERSNICTRVLEKKTKVVIGNTVTTALGVDFTSTNVVVYFSPTNRNELFLQSLDRIRRLSSVEKGFTSFLIFMLICDPIEQKIYEGLQDKTMTQDKMLQMMRDELVKEIKYVH